KPQLFLVGNWFAFFAIATSMLGVSFSLVDFLGDALQQKNRLLLTALTFVPPFCCAVLDPDVFNRALGYVGGFGEAFLNGILPVTLVWISRYKQGFVTQQLLPGGKLLLMLLFAFAVFVVGIELYIIAR